MIFVTRKHFFEISNEVGDTMWLYSTKWLDTCSFWYENIEGLFHVHRENKTFDQQFIYYAGVKSAADISMQPAGFPIIQLRSLFL